MLAGRSILFFGIVHAPQLTPVFSSGIQCQLGGTHQSETSNVVDIKDS